jgi:hypothetical protein
MNIQTLTQSPSLLSRPYKYLRLDWSEELSVLRLRTCVKPIQCYSLAGLSEIQSVLNDISAHLMSMGFLILGVICLCLCCSFVRKTLTLYACTVGAVSS